jgi:hypothetical protein
LRQPDRDPGGFELGDVGLLAASERRRGVDHADHAECGPHPQRLTLLRDSFDDLRRQIPQCEQISAVRRFMRAPPSTRMPRRRSNISPTPARSAAVWVSRRSLASPSRVEISCLGATTKGLVADHGLDLAPALDRFDQQHRRTWACQVTVR